MNDDMKTRPETTAPEGDEAFAWTDDEPGGAATGDATSGNQQWLSQLQAMIENIAEQAGPFLRQVSAKAAELAAVAGEKAGPVAARAADLTAEAGDRIAERSRDFATELRRDQAARAADAASEASADSGDAASAARDESARD
ncbi:MAG: hypothetical protein HYX54_03685 [Chloroflexi bacterium]|nr:hypothetical protein [Chloroflexota bacterium]